ncbi:hypothetical protein BBK36DRAFT_2536 [Trichoderma citrinoviride]|uniref:Uncharacterized protein n=1 Tax=Trichoderma citrinoviride TaxID=58853 RepID=A0A2T4BIL4_9HYPO|nr:hypothetical protein BBK36DRAFT_2536 [Trichoderma citrinoviride]PTB69166.1 hypothetical protein BBK36DRAFT_2536 [Trichoderma citrinoviride]
MNVFRNKKKGKDEAESARPSMESESSSPFRMFGKKKGQSEETKPELDISSALPSTDDFRTSLLMTGLSARFSMLREQDDPTTKVGKASDDSVLFPRGQSNWNLGGLQDIAEVESIRSPSISRLEPFNIDDSGSVMNRAKPVDGNTLFGGRQKVYRLPANGSGAGKDGPMSSRTLLEDDVGMSAFQKWRLAEKERQMAEGGDSSSNEAADLESQSDSHLEPPQDSQSELLSESRSETSRRRETSSTVSSVAARYSTATSVTSQGATSVRDSQFTSSTSSSSAERSVLRTRRLYEQGLSRDLQDQQSSAMSRMDHLSKGRPFASAMPDGASPTASAFGDRILERRPILAKASAPNLRSFTPSATNSASASPSETSSKFPAAGVSKSNFGAAPISPPMSEPEDHPMLAIQPNDRGKATAMGVFERPAEKYDDSTYAQRQLQLQQGRETPVNRHRSMESSVSATSDIKSSSAMQQNKAEPATAKAVAPEDPPSFFDDSDDDSSMLNGAPNTIKSPNPSLSVERPNDGDHPAFKGSAIPAPLSLGPRGPSGNLSAAPSPVPAAPQDSPTLGPNTGLSGMVRAHLRSDSNASSVYGMPAEESEPTRAQSGLGLDHDRSPGSAQSATHGRPPMSRSPSRPRASNDEVEREEEDAFARHLADGARRVREKLGSMVDAEMDRPSPMTPSALDSPKDVPPPRTNALGILKSKSSHTSLFDRHARDQSQPRSMKMVMSSNGSLPPSRRGSTEAADDSRRGRSTQARERPSDRGVSTDKEDNVPVGLKAFRQARLELQKMKDVDTTQRPSERPPLSARLASHDAGGPPPAMFNRKARDESRHGSGSRATSRAGSRAPSERERSGSETSNTGPPPLRPMRLRNGSNAYDDQYMPVSPPGSARSAPGMRHGPPSARQRPPYEAGQPSPMASPVGMGTRSRNGSLLGATASTPNLLSNAAAPPLPPINPRRKTLGRGSEDGGMPSPRVPGGFPGQDESDDDTLAQRRQKLRKATSEGTSLRSRNVPPPSNGMRPPMPQGGLPGGLI